jgi:hypothetical protein
MPFYQFRFIDTGGRVVVGEDHDCADDKGALLRAYSELEQRPFRRVEVWLRDRRIASLGASSLPFAVWTSSYPGYQNLSPSSGARSCCRAAAIGLSKNEPPKLTPP